MAETLISIRSILGIPEVSSDSKKRLRAKVYADTVPATVADDGLSGKERDAGEESGDEWSGLSSLEHANGPEELEMNDDDDEDYEVYASRLAASSDEDSSAGK